MSKRKVYFVSPNFGSEEKDWKVKMKGNERASGLFENKAEAVDCAKELAKKAQLGQVVVRDKKGVIQTEFTYGSDPEKTKG